MNVIKGNFANGLTCLNLVAGIMSIICAVSGSDPLWGMTGTHWSWVFIGIAALADFFDGFAARMLHAYSDLGKELDSLCDNVSFGVAPALSLFFALAGTDAAPWIKWLCPAIAVCGALRLARFNIDDSQATSFVGLPIPGNAIFWVGFMAQLEFAPEWMFTPWLLVPLILGESWLMVSNVRMFSFKMKHIGWRGNEARWLTALSFPVALVLAGVAGLMWTIIVYVALSLTPLGRKAI